MCINISLNMPSFLHVASFILWLRFTECPWRHHLTVAEGMSPRKISEAEGSKFSCQSTCDSWVFPFFSLISSKCISMISQRLTKEKKTISGVKAVIWDKNQNRIIFINRAPKIKVNTKKTWPAIIWKFIMIYDRKVISLN